MDNKTKQLIWKAYQLGIDHAVNFCGYNTTVLTMIAPENRKEFMERFKKPEFIKSRKKLIKKLNQQTNDTPTNRPTDK